MKLASYLTLAAASLLFSPLALSEPATDEETEMVVEADISEAQDQTQVQEPETLPLPLEELRKFTEVFGTIKNEYVEEIDDVTLINYAIRGMLSSLDPHSAYLDTSAFSDLQENTSGSFGGLGIEVSMENGFVKVISPIDDTPAKKGGIESGDLIIRIDETPVKGMSLNQAVEKMRGDAGTKITLTIVREGAREPFEVELTRATVKVTSVKTVKLDENYGYLRITQFQAQTGDDFAEGIARLKRDLSNFSGLIIDLRNNPGGVLQAAVEVADQLLEEGLIVYTKGRSKEAELSFSATAGDSLEGMPIMVLINGGSASASEILAGALQDHKRAVILGTQSFGKGSVQNVRALTEEHGLKLTTARYYTPNGRSIQAQGIEPNIPVKRAKLSDEQSSDFFREADLAGHLQNDETNDDNAESESDLTPEEKEEARKRALLEQDFQLQEALNLLKAIDILSIPLK